MKTKTIKQVLRKKFDEFLASIDDEHTRKLVKKNSIVTGGSIASMLLQEEVNDYDVYFTNRETVIAVCEYYIRKFSENNPSRPSFYIMEDGINISKDTKIADLDMFKGRTAYYDLDADLPVDPDQKSRIKIRVVSQGTAIEDGYTLNEEDGAIDALEPIEGVTVEHGYKMPDDNAVNSADAIDPGIEPSMVNPDIEMKESGEESNKESNNMYRPVYISSNAITLSDQMQLIVRFYGDAEVIHTNYDFVHCTCWWSSDTGHLELPSEALECLLTRELRYKGSKYPLASIIRTRKFINRGFTINAGQYLKMCMQLDRLNLQNIAVLEDQLTGVDAVYFAKMLSSIPESAKFGNEIETDYVINMIDKFF